VYGVFVALFSAILFKPNIVTLPDRLRLELKQALKPSRQDKGLPLSHNSIGIDEIEEVLDTLLSRQLTAGQKVLRLESEFAEKLGRKHAIMVNSGSSANLLILAGLCSPNCPKEWQLKKNDEIIVPALTWITTVTPVIQHGLTPVIVDADPTTLQMSADKLKSAVSEKTRACFAVHILGNAAPLTQYREVLPKSIFLLEDVCESLGVRFKGQYVGTAGLASSYSFYFSHHITTAEGGIVTTDDDVLADLMRSIRAHGWTRDMGDRGRAIEAQHQNIDPRFLFAELGYNLRSTDLNASIGLLQLKKLDRFNNARNLAQSKMKDALSDLQDELQFIEATPDTEPSWFGFPVILKNGELLRQ